MQRSKKPLFNHLIGGNQKRLWHGQAERFRGVQVDDELKFGRLHNRQVGGLLALENPSHIDPGLVIAVGKLRSISDEAARGHVFLLPIHHRDGVTRRKRDKVLVPGAEEWIVAENEGVDVLLLQSREDGIDL